MCDFGNLEREIGRLEAAGVRALHLDVMDGVFVPNFTYGMTIVSAIRKLTRLPLDVHLMIQNPGQYIDAFVSAGADLLTFHAEAVADPQVVIDQIHRHGVAAGIAINASTPVSKIESCLPDCELALIMSIEAGFGGQPFEDAVLPKFQQVREIAGEGILLEIDGGINQGTIRKACEHGAELLVVGSAIFKNPNYELALAELNAEIANARVG
jgi:ribulose-phosphate 3-epimerase